MDWTSHSRLPEITLGNLNEPECCEKSPDMRGIAFSRRMRYWLLFKGMRESRTGRGMGRNTSFEKVPLKVDKN